MSIKRIGPLGARFLLAIVLLFGTLFGTSFVDQALAAAGDLTRVSVAEDGSQSNGFSDWANLSADGRFITLYSEGSNLITGDTNDVSDVFVRDTQTGILERVSLSSSGGQGNGDSHDAVISADGRYVSFISHSTNLVPLSDTSGSYDIFVHDRQSGTTTAVTISVNGELGSDGRHSYHQSISANGRYVAFNSSQPELVAGDTNLISDIFVRDMHTGSLSRLSVGPGGEQSDGGSFYTGMSEDGRYIVYHSAATNLVAADTNGMIDVFVHDLQTGTTTRLTTGPGGVQTDEDSLYPSISADGRFVAYRSAATNLVAGDTNGKWDIFLHDRQTGVTSLVSVASGGGLANNDSLKATISADGRYVTFDSYASNLVADDTNGQGDVFVRDMQAGTTTRVSLASDGSEGLGGEAMYPAISSSGQYIAFTSFATNLVPNDTNAVADIFVYEQNAPAVSTPSSQPTSTPDACTDPFFCNPVAGITSRWKCNIPECAGIDWVGAVIGWPSWSAYQSNARTGNNSRSVFAADGGAPLYPYMGAWADGCQVTAVSGDVLIIEWQRGSEVWRATPLMVGESYTIDLSAPEDGAMIEAQDGYTAFSVSLANCTPQNIHSTPTSTPIGTATATHTQIFTPTATHTFTPSPTPTFTETSTPTQAPTATHTFTPSPTATFTETATAVPTQTFTATPTATFTETATPTSSHTPSVTPTATHTFTPTPTTTFTATASNTPTATYTATATPTSTPPYSYQPLYLSLRESQTVGGVVSHDEDILKFDGQTWSRFFDGSDVGLTGTNLSSFSIVDSDTILMVFSTNVTLNGIVVTPQDIVRFEATSLGKITAGIFRMYLDGSDVELTTPDESLDAVSVLPDGRVLISTTGNPTLAGVLRSDEDVMAFTPKTKGMSTTGTWALYFDGSDVGLADTTSEDVDDLDVTDDGTIYISTLGKFVVNGISGANEDIFACLPTSLGKLTACNYSPALYFDGSTWGLSENDVDAFNFLVPETVQVLGP